MPRSSGVLLHPTSLPGHFGAGDVGPAARAFVGWLGRARQRVWQVLPLGPTDGAGSPYNSPSAFAGDPALISIEDLVSDGWLSDDAPGLTALRAVPSRDQVDGACVLARLTLVRVAARAVVAQLAGSPPAPAWTAFLAAHPWVASWARFTALKAQHQGRAWWEWADDAVPDPDAEAEEVAIQWLFAGQWARLRAAAAVAGVTIVGDLPIFVSADSADVYAHRGLFLLDAAGRPREVAGVPPDAFSPTGQMWGMPLYDWEANAADGFAWWRQRLTALLGRVDRVRVDHFRGFEAAWHVPADAEDARAGRWVPGPGAALFSALSAEVGGELPVIAEDLGVITPEVEALRDAFRLPGMRILQFAFGGDPNHLYLPHTYPERCVVYTGTHDNQTTVGWWREIGAEERARVEEYLGGPVREPPWELIRLAAESRADLAVFPAQDLLGLGAEARTNTPGRAHGNWGWRALPDALDDVVAGRLAEITARARRDGHRSAAPSFGESP